MTSQKQAKANRRNGLKSTGPKTPEGKVIVSKNATTHGLRAQHTVIDGESQTEFNEFYNELILYLAPVGPMEQLLASRLITASWRLRRVAKIEVELFNYLQQPKPTPSIDSCNDDTQKYNPPYQMNVVKTYSAESSSEHREKYSTEQAKAKLKELKETFERISHMDVSTKNIPALKQYLIDLSTLDLSQESLSQLSEAIDELTEIENSIKAQAIDDFRMKFPLGRIIHDDLKSRTALTTFHRYEVNIERSFFKSLHELQRLQATRCGGSVSIPAALDINMP